MPYMFINPAEISETADSNDMLDLRVIRGKFLQFSQWAKNVERCRAAGHACTNSIVNACFCAGEFKTLLSAVTLDSVKDEIVEVNRFLNTLISQKADEVA